MRHLLLFIFSLLILGFVSSCGGDEKGCTDPTSVNYNPDAVEDDGTCIADDRPKFYGNYLGEFRCTDSLYISKLDNDSLMFSISEPIDPNDFTAVTLTLAIDGIPVDLNGTIAGSVLTIEDKLENFTIPEFLNGLPVTVDVTGLGTATLSEDGQRLSGPLTLTMALVGATTGFMDTCELDGLKQ